MLSKPQTISFATDLIKPYINALGDCENDKTSYKESITRVYQKISSKSFASHYIDLLIEFSRALSLSNNIVFQSKPTFRVQATGFKSVPFHIDKWSGHPSEIINVWLPLTPTNEHNCLYIVQKTHSSELISSIESGEISLDQLEAQSRKVSQAYPVQPGEALIFNNSFLHGTMVNESSKPRASIDFRIALDVNNLGSKKIGRDYKTIDNFNPSDTFKIQAHSVVYASGKYHYVSHATQRSAIDQYSREHGFRVTTESSEFIGCEGIPQIMQYLVSTDMPIIMFSLNCFDEQQQRLISNLPKHYKSRLHFVIDGD